MVISTSFSRTIVPPPFMLSVTVNRRCPIQARTATTEFVTEGDTAERPMGPAAVVTGLTHPNTRVHGVARSRVLIIRIEIRRVGDPRAVMATSLHLVEHTGLGHPVVHRELVAIFGLLDLAINESRVREGRVAPK